MLLVSYTLKELEKRAGVRVAKPFTHIFMIVFLSNPRITFAKRKYCKMSTALITKALDRHPDDPSSNPRLIDTKNFCYSLWSLLLLGRHVKYLVPTLNVREDSIVKL